MVILTKLYTAFCGKLVGEDKSGNRYFTNKKPDSLGNCRRWVIYKGKSEATKIPPKWHCWIHYTVDEVPE